MLLQDAEAFTGAIEIGVKNSEDGGIHDLLLYSLRAGMGRAGPTRLGPLCCAVTRMTTAVFLMLGMVAGGAIGLWVGGLRARREAAAEILQLTCDVSSAQATLQELRAQVSGRDGEIAVLRKAIDLEKESSTDARARLDAARVNFAEQRQQIEEMEKKVKATCAELSGAALK